MFGFLVGISCVCGTFLYFVCKQSEAESCAAVVNRHYDTDHISNLLIKIKVADNFVLTKVVVKVLSLLGLKAVPGEFAIPQNASILEVMRIFNSGNSITHRITLIEGRAIVRFIKEIENNPHLQGTITEMPEEGSLMPDTYFFKHPTSKQQIIDLAKSTMTKFIQKEWPKRSKNCVVTTPQEALILASIVEGETREEHVEVASVYSHRLKKNMKLQACPTVIYAITKGAVPKLHVSFKDLKVQSPYNTYVNFGLPPTPICCPSRKSILAVLHPEITNNLFFVYDPSIAKHVYSEDYKTHKRHADRIREMNKRKKQAQKVDN